MTESRASRAAAVRALGGRFLTFAAIGGVGTAAHYVVLVVLHEFGSLNATLASTCGFAVGGLVNYWLNYVITFARAVPHAQAAPRFAATALLGMGLNGALMFALVDMLSVHYLLGQVVATGVCLLWNFLVNHYWSFRPARAVEPASRVVSRG